MSCSFMMSHSRAALSNQMLIRSLSMPVIVAGGVLNISHAVAPKSSSGKQPSTFGACLLIRATSTSALSRILLVSPAGCK